MLGLGAISSRAISGGAASLVSVTVTLSCSGSLLTLSGSLDAGVYIPMSVSGTLLTLSGIAPGVWLQDMAASGPLIELGGSPILRVAGKPFRVRMIAQPYMVRAPYEKTTIKLVSQPYKVRGYR